MKYKVEVNETQHWTYVYEVEAKSSEEASCIAEALHFEGVQSDDNWLNDSTTERVYVKDSIDKEFFNRITNNLLGEKNA